LTNRLTFHFLPEKFGRNGICAYLCSAHVHVGKRGMENLCKIWLEPEVELAKQGDLTDAQVKQVIKIASDYRAQLLRQWELFKSGKAIRIIKVKK